MNFTVKNAALSVASAVALIALALPGPARADTGARLPATPPPSIGYFGYFPYVLDYAQAQAWSLRPPYYTRQLYDYCDYRNCTLERRAVVKADGSQTFSWVPVWYGPRD